LIYEPLKGNVVQVMFSSFGEVALPCLFGAIGLSLMYRHKCCAVRGTLVTTTYSSKPVGGGVGVLIPCKQVPHFSCKTDQHTLQWLV